MTDSHDSSTDRASLFRYQYLRRVAIFIGILIIGLATLVIAPAWPSEFAFRSVQFVGIGLIWAGILGRLWSILYIGGRKSTDVVSAGPYSVMRNPLYFFSSIAATGVGAITGSIIMALLFGTLCVLAFLIVIKREEAFLGGTFGKQYADYCARVPRFFPKLSLFKDEDTLEVSLRRVYSTFLDGLVFFAALPLFALVSYLQDAGYLPVLLHLY